MALKGQKISKAKDTGALGTRLLIIPELRVMVLTKRHVGSENEIVVILTKIHSKYYYKGKHKRSAVVWKLQKIFLDPR